MPPTIFSAMSSSKKFVYQPLVYWPYGIPTILSPEISVRSVPHIPDETDSFVRYSLSGYELKTLKASPAWLCCEFADVGVNGTVRQQRAAELVKNTQLAVQIVTKTGLWVGTVLIFQERESEMNIIHAENKPPMQSTVWARMCGSQQSSLNEMKCVVRGVHAAFNHNVTRLVNPLYFLELGMEATNLHMQIFLWVTGLDSLLMAGNVRLFVEHMNNFLDGDSFVFPHLYGFGQPKYLVRDVAEDLYELRSIIAHGRQIPSKFREAVGFEDTNGHPIDGYEPSNQYRQVLLESAFLLLVRALKTVFVEDLSNVVSKTNVWRQRLSISF